MSFSTHIDNKEKDMLVIGKEPTQGSEHTLTVNIWWKKYVCLDS